MANETSVLVRLSLPEQYWRNPDNRVEAFYMPDQLELCLDIMNAQRNPFQRG
jgi:hypothetical protein